MKSLQRLFWALLLSTGVHLCLLGCWSSPQSGTYSHGRLDVKISQLAPKESSTYPTPTEQPPTPDDQPAADTSALPLPPNDDDPAVAADRIVFGSEGLDSPLNLETELVLEPAETYPDALPGRIELNLLIGEEGNILWIGTEYSDVDETTLQFITESFSKARFSKPTVAGLARKVMIRVEILVGAAKAD